MVIEPTPGLSGGWLNGWLAALGVAALLPDVLLSWSRDPVPCATFHHGGGPPLAERIAEALPDEAALHESVLASLPRRVALEAFQGAAERSRKREDSSIARSVSDLVSGKSFRGDDLPHGGFDPPAPKGTTLVDRVIKCRQLLEPNPAQRIRATLQGTAVRERANGLGFDIRRIPSGVQPDADVRVDPAVECLCFVALEVFPVRGDGRRVLQRGWRDRETRRGAFAWPVWTEPLDIWAIDALLDHFFASPGEATEPGLGVHGVYGTVPFKPTGSSDTTRGYGAERLG